MANISNIYVCERMNGNWFILRNLSTNDLVLVEMPEDTKVGTFLPQDVAEDIWKFNRKEIQYKNLVSYKYDYLNYYKSGDYEKKDYKTGGIKNEGKRAHILDFADRKRNFIGFSQNSRYYQSIEAEFLKLQENRKTHNSKAWNTPDINHLNSSQGFAISFFQPLILDKIFMGNVSEYEYEKVFDEKEGTNFDLWTKDGDIETVYEVKLSETSFGNAKTDERHIKKYHEIYEPNLKELCEKELSMNQFFESYQIFRNMLFVLKDNAKCNFVYPKSRKDLTARIMLAKEYLKPEYRERVNIIYVDEIVNQIMEGDYSKELRKYFNEFKSKYL